jgi:DNA polymerase I-like protein with 3'-5' exonuclease and polymerase domains
LLTENLMQATCARLLYRALVACEKAGLETVLHVYDSILIEAATKTAKRAAATLRDIMCEAPPWGVDMKLAVDQHTGKRWTKN